MTRKDYELIAAAIRQAQELILASSEQSRFHKTLQLDGIATVQDRFGDLLRSTNPRFDRERFDTACLPALSVTHTPGS